MKSRVEFSIADVRVPSKKNRYQVRFSRAFEQATSSIRAKLRQYRQRIAWIGPSPEVRAAQEQIAWVARSQCREQFSGPVRLEVEVAGKGSSKALVVRLEELEEGNTSRRAGDLDGILTTVMDGLQQWPLVDDAQVVEVLIRRA